MALFVLGLIVLFALYDQLGGTRKLFHNPVLILMLFLPMLPSLVFAMMASKNSKALSKTLFADAPKGGSVDGKPSAK